MTDPVVEDLRRRPPTRLSEALRRIVRARVTAGIVTILPLLITLWVLKLIFVTMRDASQWVLKGLLLGRWSPEKGGDLPPVLVWLRFDFNAYEKLAPAQRAAEFFELLPWEMRWGVALVSVLLTVFFLYLVGMLAANIVGRRVLMALEALLERVPLVKTVYRGMKQILAALAGQQSQSFRKVALVPFPQEKMRCVGFVTNVFRDSVTNEELCSVFIPTTPNPTTGYLQILKREDLTEVNWTIEDAISTIVSGGTLKPRFLTIVPNKNLPASVPTGVGPGELPPSPVVSPPAADSPGILPTQ